MITAVVNALLVGRLVTYSQLKRDPLSIIPTNVGFLMPLLFIVAVGGTDLLPEVLIGVFVSTLSFSGLTASMESYYTGKMTRLIDLFVASPVHPLSYFVGSTLPQIALFLPAVLVSFIFLMREEELGATMLIIVPIALLTWLGTASLGFHLAMRFSRAAPWRVSSLSFMSGFVIVLLPPVFYPASNLGAFAWVAYLSPASTGATLIRHLATDEAINAVAGWLALAFWSAVPAWFITYRSPWREN